MLQWHSIFDLRFCAVVVQIFALAIVSASLHCALDTFGFSNNIEHSLSVSDNNTVGNDALYPSRHFVECLENASMLLSVSVSVLNLQIFLLSLSVVQLATASASLRCGILSFSASRHSLYNCRWHCRLWTQYF